MPEQDVYRACHCGSGKKLKFCCLSVMEELGRAAELEEREQFEKVVPYLEGVLKKGVSERSARTGVRLTVAINLMRLGNGANEAIISDRMRTLVQEMLKDTPDHPEVLALDAMQELQDKGYPAAQKKFSRMLQKINGQQSPWGATALYALGEYLLRDAHSLAGIKHYFQSGLQSNAENREALFEDISQLTRSGGLLYPFRLNYQLRPIAGLGALQAQFETATKLAAIGCFSDAAKAFAPVARERRNDWQVWWNMGLCHAWAAEDPLAVMALTAASSEAAAADPETAADCLMLARLLDQPGDDVAIETLQHDFTVGSMTRILMLLDESKRLSRVDEKHDHDHDSATAHEPHNPSSVTYAVLDKPLPENPDPDFVDWPNVCGTLVVFAGDEKSNTPAKARLIAIGRENATGLMAYLQEIACGELTPTGDLEVDLKLFPEQVLCDRNAFIVSKSPLANMQAARAAVARKIDLWFQQPQSILRGLTPTEAAKDPELGVALRAAVLLMEAYFHRRDQLIEVDEIRERLALPPTPKFSVTDEELRDLGPLSYRRVDLTTAPENVVLKLLLDAQGTESPILVPCLREVPRRPATFNDPRITEFAQLSLVRFLQRYMRLEESLAVCASAVEQGRKAKQPMQLLATWELRLLVQLNFLERRDEAKEVGLRLWTQYIPKLPELRKELVTALRTQIPEGPWHASDAMIPTAGTTTAGGIWTPGAPAAEAPGKLWIPGS